MKSGYDRHYYLGRDIPEVRNYAKGQLRSDQLACLAYAYGGDGRFASQALAASRGASRTPRLVLDIGAGRGELAAAFALAGVEVVGLEPSRAARTIYRRTLRTWGGSEPVLARDIDDVEGCPDTVICCESLEHIPAGEFDRMWFRICEWLDRTRGRFIVANWRDNHPIEVDDSNWDHVRRVDDELYDSLSADAREVVYREGSHLVLSW